MTISNGVDDTSWKQFHADIDEQLNQRRPDRVGSSEKDWREPVYAWARNHMPDETHLVRVVAQREVDRREQEATKKGYRIIRQYADGQAPLSWEIIGPYPIIVDGLRIRLDAATPDDIEDACRELEATAKKSYDQVIVLVNCFRDLARSARRAGYATVAQIGDQEALYGDLELPAMNDEDDDDL